MAQTILTLKDELAGMLHGTNIDDVHYSLGVFYRAGRQVLLDCDPFETKRLAELTTPVYEGIFSYAVPTDLKMNKVVDIRPQVLRETAENFDQRYSEEFDLLKENNTFNVEYVNNTKTINISKSLNSGSRVSDFASTTGWAAADDATNITLDQIYYSYGSSSLNFDLDGSTTSGYIENSTLSSVDLSAHEDKARMFLDVYFPDSSLITNVILRWGNDTSNYFSVTSTSPFNSSAFSNGWNTIDFNWNGAAETGTVDTTVIDYVRITITYDGTAETDIRVDNLRSILGTIYDLQYYSNFLYTDATTGNLKEQPEVDNDSCILEPQSMNLYLSKVAEFAAQQAQQQGASVDVGYFANEYANHLKRYKAMFPSEAIKPKSFIYRPRVSSLRRSSRIDS